MLLICSCNKQNFYLLPLCFFICYSRALDAFLKKKMNFEIMIESVKQAT